MVCVKGAFLATETLIPSTENLAKIYAFMLSMLADPDDSPFVLKAAEAAALPFLRRVDTLYSAVPPPPSWSSPQRK
jgi:hypothetical protein